VTPETPLKEVAHMLPPESAEALLFLNATLQGAILHDIREVIVSWEQSGVDLDPITFSKIIVPVVAKITGINMMAYKLMMKEQ
jgi:hypothetical protein